MLQNAASTARLCVRLAIRRPCRIAITNRRYTALKWISTPGFQPHLPASQTCAIRSYTNTSEPVVDETIYALSTAQAKAGIAIVRISGPAWLDIYNSLCPGKAALKPRYASARTLFDPSNPSNILDTEALVLHFPAPKSVTGEDVLELHIHGGPATVKAVLSAVHRCQSPLPIRYAEPGEFTRRAFQNDRLDLAQVEALSDTLSAETEEQRRAAVRGHSGNLGRTYEQWREQLLYARGELEALIDFSEDQHFDESPAELLSNVTLQVNRIIKSIDQYKYASLRGELLKKGIRISLIGPPNAGKSSLLNLIVGREASIVSQEAGTTRDVVEVSVNIRGYLCTFADTAGIRDPKTSKSVVGNIELEGMRRAKAKASESDLVIILASYDSTGEINCDKETLEIAKNAPRALAVVNKFDVLGPSVDAYSQLGSSTKSFQVTKILGGALFVPISCKLARSGEGNDPGNINELMDTLVGVFKSMTDLPPEYEDLLGVTERQRQLLSTCSEHLELFIQEAQASEQGRDSDIVLAAEHLRSAANCLSRITGRGEASDVEEVLGVVFEKFCVGK